jgi:hypothetical protein
MSDQSEEKNGITILGQTLVYPKTLYGALCVLFLSSAIVSSLYIIFHATPAQIKAFHSLYATVKVDAETKETVENDTLRYEFWTPSSKTKDYVEKHEGEVAQRDKWELDVTEDKVIKFGETLRGTSGVEGYRRVEAWGHGRSRFKPGWWWTMRVNRGYSVEKLAKEYREFWGTTEPMFIEVFDNKGIFK